MFGMGAGARVRELNDGSEHAAGSMRPHFRELATINRALKERRRQLCEEEKLEMEGEGCVWISSLLIR